MPALCSLILDVYLPGGLVVDWSVSSDPDHAYPFLLGPQRYEGQEIDPISAAATIGTVEVGVIDPAQIPGQQATGWMTERIGSIRGRRCVLRRYVGETIGYVRIADGPAGTPKLDASYSAYRWPIRDTREVERKLRAFNDAWTTGIVPRGPVAGFGRKPDDSFLLPPVTPVVGTYTVAEGPIRFGYILLDDLWVDDVPDPSIVISKEGLELIANQGDGSRSSFPKADVLWRVAGSDDPWNVARPIYPGTNISGDFSIGFYRDGTIDDEPVIALGLVYLWIQEDGAVYPNAPFGASPVDGVGTQIEFIVRSRGPASEDYPFYFEGTAGELIAKLYDGDLSSNEPIAAAADLVGALYDPAGLENIAEMLAGHVRYDAPAIAAMTEKVTLRQTEETKDGRDWAEKMVYGPTGWIPALDNDGVVSPVSRSRPTVVSGPMINDAKAEPSPDWNAGEIIVTSVAVTFNRYYVPTGDLAILTKLSPDGLAIRPITEIYEDPEAETTEGEQPQTFDGSAFSAVADEFGNAIGGDIEAGALIAQRARFEVLGRYRSGAQAIRVAVRRVDVPTLRIGDWCPVQLSWLPNYLTRLRGSDLVAVQVLSIDDSECAWRKLLLEESSVVTEPGYFDGGEVLTDVGEPGYFDSGEFISDVEE